MAEVDKKAEQPAPGAPARPALQQVGDDRGEGGQQDIRTDSIAAAPADPAAPAGLPDRERR